jgi:hypothetical protein
MCHVIKQQQMREENSHHVNAEKSTKSIYVIYTQFVMEATAAICVITKNYNLNQQFSNHYDGSNAEHVL